jgi:hypothetical protein
LLLAHNDWHSLGRRPLKAAACYNKENQAKTVSERKQCSFAGDEVLEWNGRELQNASFDEVCDIINESKHDPQVELIVSRPIA